MFAFPIAVIEAESLGVAIGLYVCTYKCIS